MAINGISGYTNRNLSKYAELSAKTYSNNNKQMQPINKPLPEWKTDSFYLSPAAQSQEKSLYFNSSDFEGTLNAVKNN